MMILLGGSYPPNVAVLWDEKKRAVQFRLKFRSEVIRAFMRVEICAVALSDVLHLFELRQGAKELPLIKTYHLNTHCPGVFAMSTAGDPIVAFPSVRKGEVVVANVTTSETAVVSAHADHIAALCLSSIGNVLCTASKEGRYIKIFDVVSGSLLFRLYRGFQRADIPSLCLHSSGNWLVFAASTGTCHIFDLRSHGNHGRGNQNRSKGAVWKTASNLVTGKKFNRHYASFSVVERSPVSFYAVCCFAEGNGVGKGDGKVTGTEGDHYSKEAHTILSKYPPPIHVASADGTFYDCVFDAVNRSYACVGAYRFDL
jgi:hypothetical protein